MVKDVVIGIDLPMWPNKKEEDSPPLVTKRHVEKKKIKHGVSRSKKNLDHVHQKTDD